MTSDQNIIFNIGVTLYIHHTYPSRDLLPSVKFYQQSSALEHSVAFFIRALNVLIPKLNRIRLYKRTLHAENIDLIYAELIHQRAYSSPRHFEN